MKGNEGPKGENDQFWKQFFGWICLLEISILKRLGLQIWAKKLFENTRQGNECPKGENERKWRPKRPKWKEINAQKANMKGNESAKNQNERKWRPKRPKWKEMKAQKAKMEGNEGPKGQNDQFRRQFFGWICLLEVTILERPGWQIWSKGFLKTKGKKWRPKNQNERKSTPKRPKWKEMKAQKGQNERKWRPKRPKWKEIKAQKAKMKGHEGPKGQNEKKWRPKRPKWKEMKAQKAKMTSFGSNFFAESAYLKLPFWRGSGGKFGPKAFWKHKERKWRPKRPTWKEINAQKSKMKENECPKGQNERKSRPKRPTWKEMKAQKANMKGNELQKAKMKGNESRKGQNERKWKRKKPKWKEMKAQKAKMKGNESPKGQNGRKWKPKTPKWLVLEAIFFGWICVLEVTILEKLGWQIWARCFLKTQRKEMKAQKAKMKGNESRKGQNERKWKPKKQKWPVLEAIFGRICLLEVTILQRLGWQIWARCFLKTHGKEMNAKRPKWKEMNAQKAKMKGNEGPKG